MVFFKESVRGAISVRRWNMIKSSNRAEAIVYLINSVGDAILPHAAIGESFWLCSRLSWVTHRMPNPRLWADVLSARTSNPPRRYISHAAVHQPEPE